MHMNGWDMSSRYLASASTPVNYDCGYDHDHEYYDYAHEGLTTL